MVKVISLSEAAYEKLKERKTTGKSFSDVVIELTNKKKKRSILEFFGILKDDKDLIASLEKSFKERANLKLKDIKF